MSRSTTSSRLCEPTTASSCAPFRLALLLALDLLTLSRLLSVETDFRPLRIVEHLLGHPALVMDWHGGPVLHSALNVVEADVLDEDRAGIGVLQIDRGVGEVDTARPAVGPVVMIRKLWWLA